MNRKEGSIQSCSHVGDGFCPLVIRPGWQVSQLNDRADLHGNTIGQVERHAGSDEVFVLVKGRAILVSARERANALDCDVQPMTAGVVYTVPQGVWHTIVTFPEMLVVIVEKDNTHLHDVAYRTLTKEERLALREKLECGTDGESHA